jgi:hypothetical protein
MLSLDEGIPRFRSFDQHDSFYVALNTGVNKDFDKEYNDENSMPTKKDHE